MIRKSRVWLTVVFLGWVHASAASAHAVPELKVELNLNPGSQVQVAEVPWDRLLDRFQNPGAPILFGVNLLGPSPYQRGATLDFAPASNAKLFTTGAALAMLGPDFRFETELRWRPLSSMDNRILTELSVIGSGDPTWGSPVVRLNSMADYLFSAGVREVRGEVKFAGNDPRWSFSPIPRGWEDSDYWNCVGPLAHAFNLGSNCAGYRVTGQSQGHWEENGVATPVRFQIAKGATTSLRVEAEPAGYVVAGTWAAKSGSRTFYLPVPDTENWARNLFLAALKRKGIRVTGVSGKGRSPAGSPTPGKEPPDYQSAHFYSEPLKDIIKLFLKKSVNLTGDAIFKAVGQASHHSDSNLLAAGQEAMKDFVEHLGRVQADKAEIQEIPGFFANQAVILDGAGISRESHVTVGAMMALLQDLKLNPNFTDVWNALPIAGVDGTLANRMHGTPAEGVLRAKTGTLRGVYNLSGYVPRYGRNGTSVEEFVPFVVLTQSSSPSNRSRCIQAEDSVGAELARSVNRNSTQQEL